MKKGREGREDGSVMGLSNGAAVGTVEREKGKLQGEKREKEKEKKAGEVQN
jgi:hypothetical protein